MGAALPACRCIACCALLLAAPLLPAIAQDSREAWLLQTLRQDNPVREQLAMLGRPGQPLSIRVYRGPRLPCGRRARMQDGELALSEGLLDELHAMEGRHGNAAPDPGGSAGRWSLLYVLAYLAATAPQGTALPEPQRRAAAMLVAANQVMASAWEQAGRPHQGAQRARLQAAVLNQIPYARLLRNDAVHLRSDGDGFVLDSGNVQVLAALLARAGNVTGLD